MLQAIERWILRLLHRRCPHRPSNVAADILEGGGGGPVLWCRDCGAIDRLGLGYWELAVDPFARGRTAPEMPKFQGLCNLERFLDEDLSPEEARRRVLENLGHRIRSSEISEGPSGLVPRATSSRDSSFAGLPGADPSTATSSTKPIGRSDNQRR